MPLFRFTILITCVILAAGLTIAVASTFDGFAGLSLPLLFCSAVLLWVSLQRRK